LDHPLTQNLDLNLAENDLRTSSSTPNEMDLNDYRPFMNEVDDQILVSSLNSVLDTANSMNQFGTPQSTSISNKNLDEGGYLPQEGGYAFHTMKLSPFF
jgi:hypothetical protein